MLSPLRVNGVDDSIEFIPSPGRSPGSRRVRSISSSDKHPSVLRTGNREIYTRGRPPWYDVQGHQNHDPFIIGLCGGSSSGKTTVARNIIEKLDLQWVCLLSMDSFYKVLTPEQSQLAYNNDYDFDSPSAIDFDILIHTMQQLKQGRQVQVPVYDFTTHSRLKDWKTLYGADVILFEGILAFANPEVRELLDMKIFVDTDADERLSRRLRRDIQVRGRELQGVIKQYLRFVKPSYEHFIEPMKIYADIIVPRGGENEVAIDLIVQHVNQQFEQRGRTIQKDLASVDNMGTPEHLFILENTKSVKALHTLIRNKDTSRDSFIFYSKRLMRLLIEYALSLLPYETVTIQTPQQSTYEGKRFLRKLSCVSLMRAGETLEPAVQEVVKDIRIGKILIQTNSETKNPELFFLRLPNEIDKDIVLLLDATVATGAAAMMAIRVLLDHDVAEDRIFFVNLLMSKTGVHSVAYAFPNVRIVTTAVDEVLNDSFCIIPGIGNFADRFFGTG